MKKEMVQIFLLSCCVVFFGCNKQADSVSTEKTETTNSPTAHPTQAARPNTPGKTAQSAPSEKGSARPRYEHLVETQQRLEAAAAARAARAQAAQEQEAADEKAGISVHGKPVPPQELVDRANGGDVAAQRELGKFFSDKGRMKAAVEWYQQAAAKGDAEAQRMLGIAYIFGDEGVERDLEKAGKWLKAAADRGDAEAQRELAKIYGEKSNTKESNDLLMKAASQGDREAQRMLGLNYTVGQGVESNREEAKKWLTLAANQGDAIAQRELGRYYGEQTQNWFGSNDPNLKQSNEWYRKAAEQGDVRAEHMMGVRYYFGQGVERDVAEANKWFLAAAEQGDAQSQFSIGMRWTRGEAGEPQDFVEAVKWFSLAANQGLDEAQVRLGQRYANGEGVDRDYVEAYKWYWLAKEQGRMADAATQLNSIATRMTPEQIAKAKAEVKAFVPKPATPLKH